MSNNQELSPIAALKQELPTLQRLVLSNAHEPIDAEALVLQELEYLNYHMMHKPVIQQCTPLSVVLAVRNVLTQNLSLDPYAGQVYVKTRKVKTRGPQGQEIEVQALEIQPSCNGLISIARQCNRILDIKRPEVKFDKKNVVESVRVELLLPSYQEPRWETFEFGAVDFTRWRRASDREKGGNGDLKKANALYTSWEGGIDPEFARAKAIRHALNKLGTNPYEKRRAGIATKPFRDVGVDVEKDRAAASDDDRTEDVAHQVVESTTTAAAPQRTEGSPVNAEEL